VIRQVRCGVSVIRRLWIAASGGKRPDAASIRSVLHVRKLVASDRDTYLPQLARSLEDLAIYLTESDRPDAALPFCEEAVAHYRELGLAGSLQTLSSVLAETGRDEQACDAAEDAVREYRALAESDPHAYLPNLAASLDVLAAQRARTGRLPEALAAPDEAATPHRAAGGHVKPTPRRAAVPARD
jgi:hypothetical protein